MDETMKKGPAHAIAEWWNKIPKQVRVAFLAAVAIGLATHLYMFVNLLPNHDAINYSLINNADMLFQGRWFQQAASLLTSAYCMPWVNGCISILALAWAVGLTVKVTGIEHPLSAVLLAGFMVTFPVIASSFAYLYMADAFMNALLLAALAVYLSRKYEKMGFLLAAICISLSMGIYQAYICFSFALFIALLIFDVLRDQKSAKEILVRGVKDFLALALGVALYMAVMTILLKVEHVELTAYQGINKMGLSSVFGIFTQVGATLKGLMTYFTKDVFRLFNRPTGVMHWIALGLTMFFGVFIFIKKRLWKKPSKTVLLVILVLILPVALDSAYLLSANSVHTLMIYSITVFFVLLIRLAELFSENTPNLNLKSIFSWITVIVSVVIIFSGYLLSNQAYFSLQAKYNQTYAYAIKVTARVEDSPAYYEDIPVAFIGASDDAPQMDTGLMGFDFGTSYILYQSRLCKNFFRDYVGSSFNCVAQDEIDRIKLTEEYAAMPAYPLQGGIKMIGNVLVVKLGD